MGKEQHKGRIAAEKHSHNACRGLFYCKLIKAHAEHHAKQTKKGQLANAGKGQSVCAALKIPQRKGYEGKAPQKKAGDVDLHGGEAVRNGLQGNLHAGEEDCCYDDKDKGSVHD